jgi:hypothetical protein
MKNQLGLWALLGLLWPQAGFAQGDCEHFANLLTPFGPGDRQLTAQVDACGVPGLATKLACFVAICGGCATIAALSCGIQI